MIIDLRVPSGDDHLLTMFMMCSSATIRINTLIRSWARSDPLMTVSVSLHLCINKFIRKLQYCILPVAHVTRWCNRLWWTIQLCSRLKWDAVTDLCIVYCRSEIIKFNKIHYKTTSVIISSVCFSLEILYSSDTQPDISINVFTDLLHLRHWSSTDFMLFKFCKVWTCCHPENLSNPQVENFLSAQPV